MAVDSYFGGIFNEIKSNDSWAFVYNVCIFLIIFAREHKHYNTIESSL